MAADGSGNKAAAAAVARPVSSPARTQARSARPGTLLSLLTGCTRTVTGPGSGSTEILIQQAPGPPPSLAAAAGSQPLRLAAHHAAAPTALPVARTDGPGLKQ